MKRILFIVPHRLDRSPGQRFRFEQYLDLLKENGYEYEFSNLINEKDDHIFYSKGNYISKAWVVLKGLLKRFRDVRRADDFDIVFIYREAIMLGTTYFERAFYKSKARVIYDFDDAIWLLDVSEGNRNIAFLKKPGKTQTLFQYADMILAGNAYLKSFASQFNANVHVIPTTIDMHYHRSIDVVKPVDQICIGWTGTETTIKHFMSLLPALEEVKKKYGDRIRFKLIAEKHVEIKSIDLTSTKWNLKDEIKQLSEIDIGIMPLPDDEWAKGKCGFKGLQYMALGIPAIMSPVGVNTSIVQDGENGFLAASKEEWIEKLSMLINSPEERKKIGQNGQETVRLHYSKQSQSDHFMKRLKQVLEVR